MKRAVVVVVIAAGLFTAGVVALGLWFAAMFGSPQR